MSKKEAAGDREPWEQQPGESAKAFAAFCVYRDLGPERSLSKVAAQLNKSMKLMGDWSGEHRWVERSEAWDRHLDKAARAAQVKRAQKMAERQAALGERMQEVAARKVQALLDATDHSKVGIDAAQAAMAGLSVSDTLRLAAEGAKLERVALGEPGEVVENREGENSNVYAEAVVQMAREREAAAAQEDAARLERLKRAAGEE